MKKLLSLIATLSVCIAAQAQDYRLLRNNRVEKITKAEDQNRVTELVRITGIDDGQELVAITMQPRNDGLTALGYNTTTREARFYFIHPRTFEASRMTYRARQLDLGNGSNVSISYLDPSLIGVEAGNGQRYEIDENTGRIVAESRQQLLVTPDHPYSGVTRPPDPFVRNQGLINADPVTTEPAVNARESTVYSEQSQTGDLPYIAHLYPNPATSITRLQLSNPSDREIQLYIIDLNGRVVQEYEFNAGTRSLDADVSALPAGLYGLQLIQDGTMLDQAQKLVRKE